MPVVGQDFAGRTALITGAASGIGAACALWLDAHGIGELVLVDLDLPGMQAFDLRCAAVPIAADVADPAAWEAIEARLPRLDHAVVNAGIANGGPLTDVDFAEWRRILSVNLDGAFLSLRTALRAIVRGGAGGSIVVTGSVVGIKPVANTAAYGSSKAAVAHLAQVAAAEHLAAGIRVNAIAPGRVDTPIWTKTEQFRELEARLGSREAALAAAAGEQAGGAHAFASAEQIAGQIGFLLSDAAANITGTVLASDGGYAL